MKIKIKLLQNQMNLLQSLPEQGMGYQVVDITLKNGKTFYEKIVLNSMYLQMDEKETIDPNEIETIKPHKL